MEVYVNGELYHRNTDLEYIKIYKSAPEIFDIIAPVRVSPGNGSTITIKSLVITELS